MRIRRLLFFLAPSLLGETTSLHEPRCLTPAALQTTAETVDVMQWGILPISELGPAIPNYDPEQRDYLIRTIVFEASGESEKGKAAVAFVILNRERSGRWGDNIEEVVTQPWQFEPWMTRRREIEKLSRDDPRYQSAARIADTVLSGQMPDPTAGATHFLNPVIVRQRRGGSLPSWARGEGQPIGRHTFYSLSEGGAEPEQPALSMSVPINPLSCGRTEDQLENPQLETDPSWGSTLQSLRQEPRAPLANSQEPASTWQNAAYGPRRYEEKNQGSERTLGAYDPAASVAKTSAPAIDKPSPKAALPKAKKQSRSAKPAVRVADEVTKRDRRRGRWARRGDRRRGLGLFGSRGRKAAPSARARERAGTAAKVGTRKGQSRPPARPRWTKTERL